MGPECGNGAPFTRSKHHPVSPRRRETRPVGEVHPVERVGPLAGGGEGERDHLLAFVPRQNVDGPGDAVDAPIDAFHRVVDQRLPGEAAIPSSHHQRIHRRPQRMERRPLGCPLLDHAAPRTAEVHPTRHHFDRRTGAAVRRPRAKPSDGVLLPPSVSGDQRLGGLAKFPAPPPAELQIDRAGLPVEFPHVDRGEVKGHQSGGRPPRVGPRVGPPDPPSASRRSSWCERSPIGRSPVSARGRRGRGWPLPPG